MQAEALQKKTQEGQEMRDKIVSLELSVSSCNEEKAHLQVRFSNVK